MAHVSPVKRLERVAQFLRTATRQIQENTSDKALQTLANATNEVKILSKDGKTNEQLQNVAPQLIQWHVDRLEAMDLLSEHADKPIHYGADDPLQLKPEQIKPFRMAIILCKGVIREFPITVKDNENSDAGVEDGSDN